MPRRVGEREQRMKVIIASHAGFCFGVRRATDAVEKEIEKADGYKIFTLGRLIHNESYVRTLEGAGVSEISGDDIPRIIERAEKGEHVTVVIRAHGELKENLDVLEKCAAENENFRLLDCTCPYVKKVRRIAAENSGDGRFFILLGAPDHPEVRGIMSCVRGCGAVYKSADELEEKLPIDLTRALAEGEGDKKNADCIPHAPTGSDPEAANEDRQYRSKERPTGHPTECPSGHPNEHLNENPDEHPNEWQDEHPGCSQNFPIGENDGNSVSNLCNMQIAIAAQTTQKTDEWKKTLKKIKKLYTTPFIFDTICNVTEERQLEARALAKKSDSVIVIGSRQSSNTVKLYEICRSICRDTYLIADASGLRNVPLPREGTISVTAGASTPLSEIQEVERNMKEQITENFAEMLEASMKTLNPGDVVVGVITSISQNEIHLDLGAKTTGVIVHEKLTDDASAKLDELFKVGDEIKAKVIKVSDIDGIATLDKLRVDSDANWLKIVDAYESGEILEGKIVDAVKGGVIASVSSVRIFIPISLTGLPRGCSDADVQALVGTTQRFKVIEIKEERKRALGSVRTVLRDERKAAEAKFWDQVEVGQIYEGPVKSLTSYGAFIDLGGVDGMVHMTELSWRRIRHPSEVVNVGDVVTVFVKGVDKEKKRISLGYKTEDSDPWFIFNNKYSVGDVAKVKIVSLMQFGAFAEVVPGADGLIHISQIADHKIATPGEVLHVGDEVDAKIVGIDQENRKISLSIRALIEPEEKEVEKEEEVVEEEDDAPVIYSTDDPESLKAFDDEEVSE